MMVEDERDRILLLEQIDNLSWECDRLREALRELVEARDSHRALEMVRWRAAFLDEDPGPENREARERLDAAWERARATLGEEGDG